MSKSTKFPASTKKLELCTLKIFEAFFWHMATSFFVVGCRTKRRYTVPHCTEHHGIKPKTIYLVVYLSTLLYYWIQ
jgi:hypothetical protein